ncbi:Hexokinase-like 2 protein [Actinidia chinensis var. chinensis]|uniref:Phosphotransferase n=1 Tax=Actinidia chinensis var. chinensis TaxID=1590841 RepID=A0A2R6PAP5_ACTCC|nr:Hexokinase-like 2 protein [Actinidia chinensis var. chinensis]
MRKEAVVVSVAVAAAVVGVAVGLRQWKRRSERRWRQTQRILRKFARECATPVPKLWHLANDLASDMQSGLAISDYQPNLRMLVSYLSPLPTGDEKGLFYGVNLRGANFLLLRARLGGKNEPISELHREEICIPSDVMNGSSKQLFDCIAVELAKYISTHSEGTESTSARQRELGFTISYPVDQVAASSGTAVKWKSLAVDDTVGKELVNDMNQALEKHGLDMRVFALVDDAIGDLAGGRYYNKETIAAITLGMGTNAAYVETAASVPKWNDPLPKSGELVINTQWGSFTSSHLPITEFDASLDAESSNPGKQIFEKLVSGMYLGEIVRRVLLKMAKETAFFGETVPAKLTTPYLLRSPDMAAMHQDTSEDHEVIDEKLKEIFGISNSTPMVREVIAEVCDIVAERGARLAGAGIVGIVKKLGRIANKRSVVTMEGGLYEHYRVFRNYLHSSVWEMLGNELSDNVIIEHSHGGSGAGSLFLAASQTQNTDS